jgi:hypothetical protein
MSLVVIFPVGQDTAATNYLSFIETNCEPGYVPWDDPSKRDKYGQRVVGYYGPGGQAGGELVALDGDEAARAAGVLQDGFDPPEEEDE